MNDNDSGMDWLDGEDDYLDSETKHYSACRSASSVEEAIKCCPEQLARPWEYHCEISGPLSLGLKKAVLQRDALRKSHDAGDSWTTEYNKGGLWAVVITAVLAIAVYCMEHFLEARFSGKNWYTLLAIVLFLGMIIALSYLFLVHVEMDLYGIGVALVVTILYVKFMHKLPVFIGMLVLCLAGCLYFLWDSTRIQRGYEKELKEREKRVASEADKFFAALKRNINAFTAEWTGDSEETDAIWKEADRRLCRELDDVKKKITGWRIDLSGVDILLEPVWKDGSGHEIYYYPDSIWWTNMDPSTEETYRMISSRGFSSRGDLEKLRKMGSEGYLEAIIDLSIAYSNGEIAERDEVEAMLWADAGRRITFIVRFLDSVGEYLVCDMPVDPQDSNCAYLLGLCYLDGNSLIGKDEKKARELINEAAFYGNDHARKWLSDRGLKVTSILDQYKNRGS